VRVRRRIGLSIETNLMRRVERMVVPMEVRGTAMSMGVGVAREDGHVAAKGGVKRVVRRFVVMTMVRWPALVRRLVAMPMIVTIVVIVVVVKQAAVTVPVSTPRLQAAPRAHGDPAPK
jgi:hypothetical protein